MPLLRKLPLLVAATVALSWLSLGAFWWANSARVELSYLTETPARDLALARYSTYEHVFIASTWYLAIGAAPLVLLQLVLWGRVRRAAPKARWLVPLMLLSTFLGLVLGGLLGVAAAVSTGGGMIG